MSSVTLGLTLIPIRALWVVVLFEARQVALVDSVDELEARFEDEGVDFVIGSSF